MTTNEEIEAITERLKILKQQQDFDAAEAIKQSKDKFMKRADSLDPKFKELYQGIDKLVASSGWKDFYFGVLNYQKNCIDSGYFFK